MTRWTIAGLLVGALLLWPAVAEGQKKGKKSKKQTIEATPTEYALLRAQPGAVGKLGSVNTSSKAFMLQIGGADSSDPTTGNNPTLAGIQSQIRLENVWQQQQRLLVAKNPLDYARRMELLRKAQRQLAQSEVRRQAQMFQKPGKAGGGMNKSPAKEFELEAIDKAVVRMGYLPLRYDDKGGVIEYTAREIDKLRGDKTKPGLAATFDDLQAGQIVRVVFAKQKPAKTAVAKKAKNAKDDEADGDSPPRPQVAMILILTESNDALPPEPKKRKKKN